MKKSIILIVLLIAIVPMAGCIDVNSPKPTQTAQVSPTIVPTVTPIPSVTVIPLPTAVKVDNAVNKQAGLLIGAWAENEYGWNNDTGIRDITFQRMDGNDYLYSFTYSGELHYIRIIYNIDSGTFSQGNVSDNINEI